MKTLFWIHITILLLFTHACSFGQVTIHYTEPLTVEEGLTNNRIKSVVQDSRGFLWIATSYGLNRYDGERVDQFVHNDSLPSIPDDAVNALLIADNDHLYIGTGTGIGVLNLQNYTFSTVHLSDAGAANEFDDQIQLLNKDQSGNIWAATPSMIYRLDNNLKILNRYRTQNYPILRRKTNVYSMISMASGEELFWLYDGLFYWSPNQPQPQLLSEVNKEALQFLRGSSFYEVALVDSRYLLYLANENQVKILDTRTGQFNQVSIDKTEFSSLTTINGTFGDTVSFTTNKEGFVLFKIADIGSRPGMVPLSKSLLPGVSIKYVFNDNEGNYWVLPAYGGLLKAIRHKQIFNHIILADSTPGESNEFEISRILPFGKKILIGSYGGGFYQYNPESGALEQHSVRIGYYNENMVWDFWSYQADTFWIGTQQGLIWCNLKNFHIGRIKIPHPSVIDSFAITNLFEDSRGLVWMGIGRGNGAAVYNKKTRKFKWYPNERGGYPYRYPLRTAEDGDGNVWFVSDHTGNLVKWERSTGQFRDVIVPGVNGELENESDGFYVDKKKGEIWYGVVSGHLINYNISSGKSVIYGIRDGYTSGAITSILADKSGKLWLGSTQGISCFDPAKKRFKNFFKRDGLPASYYSSSLYLDSLTDHLYAGAPGLLVWFDIRKTVQQLPPLKIVLTDILVNNKNEGPPTTSLTLSPGQNNIQINFTGINLSNGEENRYAYQLDRGEWISLGKQNEINFASLNPGKYEVAIRGARKDGAFTGPVTLLTFSIRPHFTQTAWFFLLCFIIAFSLVYAWYRFRIRNMRKMERMRARISRDLHDEIGSRVTNIGLMSTIAGRGSGMDHKEENWLQRIQAESQAVSQNLREIVWNINPENDSLEIALPRILRYASGFLETAGITVKAELSDLNGFRLNMEKRRDLFLIIKEAVNNIVRPSNAKNARIMITDAHNKLFLTVMDDGTGFDPEKVSMASGLRNMRERAQKNHWDFQLRSSIADGTQVSVGIKVA